MHKFLDKLHNLSSANIYFYYRYLYISDTQKLTGYDTYIIPANYSGWYITYEHDQEYKLNYFTEDIGLNLYYFYFRQQYPFWLKSEEYQMPKYRGEEYLYGHKQLMTRYYLERLSNNLGKIEEFDWYKEFYPGYYPTMTYHNGLPFPQRPYLSMFPYYKYKYIKVSISFRLNTLCYFKVIICI